MKGAIYIYSQWEGYWEDGMYQKVKEWLERCSIPKVSIHTSGHASPADLRRIVEASNPRIVVPIHTFFPGRYNELFTNARAHDDNEWWEI